MKRILVTGGAGYIGSTLCTLLINSGYAVRAIDYLVFGGESLSHLATNPNFELVNADIRDKEKLTKALNGIDGVVHLAAIVGDPACAKEPEKAESINWDAAVQLFDLVRETKSVKNFVFSSTCSNYGKMKGDGYVNEESELTPVSLYARLKVKFEQYLMESDYREDLTATALRFSTVYGYSTRMRFDLTVNEFTRDLFVGNNLVVFGEQFWRPYCHVRDLARGAMLMLESPKEKINRTVFNVGDTSENYTKKMLVDLISKHIPEAEVEYVQKSEDPRDYRVNFDKIKNTLGFEITSNVEEGVLEIIKVLSSGFISNPNDNKYSNI